MKIGKNEIGNNNPVYIIADIGLCHNGSLDIAKVLIDIAVNAGVDAVKFQKRDVENLAIPEIAAILPVSTTKAMIAEAAPPNPFNNATNWGICVILTYTASKQPATAPKAIEIQRTFREIISLSIIVVIIAINMQAAPSRFPVLAVFGEFISLIPEIIPRTQTKLISL